MHNTLRLAGCLALAVLMAAPALAQGSSDEALPTSLSSFRFNFINPGARATAENPAHAARPGEAARATPQQRPAGYQQPVGTRR